MNIQTQVVAGSVGHPAAVLLAVGRKRFLCADGQQAPFFQACGNNLHRGIVNIAEAGSGLVRALECSLAGVQNCLVNLRLSGGEGSIDGERAGDVCGVERINLNTGIDQNQVAVVHRTIVIDPVQSIRVVARGSDGVIAQAVSFFTGYRSKGALNDAFATAVTNGSRQ